MGTAEVEAPPADRIRAAAAGLAARIVRVQRLPVLDLALRAWSDRGRHRHEVPTLIACLAGNMRMETGPGRHLDLVAGEVVVVPPAVLHLHHAQRRPFCALEIGHSPSHLDVTLRDQGWSATMLLRLAEMDRSLRRLAGGGDPAEAAALLHRIATAELAPLQRPPPVQRMLQRIWWQSHLPSLRAAVVIAASGLGPTRARELFVATVGLAPKACLTRFRLGIALGLLDGGWGLEAAAREAGFADAATMRRCARATGHPLAGQDRRRR